MFSTPGEAIVLPPCENNFFAKIFCHSLFPLDFFREDFASFFPEHFSAKISPLFFRNIFFAEIFRTDKKEGIFVRGGWTLWSCPPSENAL